ncbi:MAG TPA: T9SS type A sorting domain-containing protein [Bacteroidales bacterium]|nr:T9SS type A sorting domain-containing protein [Bacteroidales bacterium]
MKMKILFLTLIFISLSCHIAAQSIEYRNVVISGPVFTFKAVGNTLYLGAGSALEIFDISNIDNIQYVGKQHSTDVVTSVAQKGNTVYAGNNGIGTAVFDVSHPAVPVFHGLLYDSLIPGHQPPAIDGNTGFFSYGSYGIKVLDLSNTLQPVEICGWQTPDFMLSIGKKGDTIYAADRNNGIFLLNYENNQLTVFDTVKHPSITSWHQFHIDTLNNYFWLYGYGSAVPYNDSLGIIVYDLNPLAFMNIVSTYKILSRPAASLTVKNDTAYLACWEDGVRVVDFSNMLNPQQVAIIPSPKYSLWVDLINDSILGIAQYDYGLEMININTHNLDTYHVIDTYGDVSGIAVSGNYVYTIVDGEGLAVCSIEPSDTLKEITMLPQFPNLKDVAVKNNYLFAASDASGVLVFDITNKELPILIDSLKKPNNNGALSLQISGNYLFAGESYYFFLSRPVLLSLWDISNISDPVFISETNITTQNFPYDRPLIFMSVRDSLLVMSCWNDALEGSMHILDVSNKSQPSILAQLPSRAGQLEITTLDQQPVILCAWGTSSLAQFNGLKIFSLDDPSAPVLSGEYQTGINGNRTIGLSVSDSYVYLAEGCLSAFGHITVLDCSNPAQPLFHSRVKIGSNTNHSHLKITGHYLLHSSGSPGLMLFKVSGSTHIAESDKKTSADILIYPNPASGKVFIELDQPSCAVIDVFDISGRQIHVNTMITNHHVQLDLSLLESGVYLIRIMTANQEYIERIFFLNNTE